MDDAALRHLAQQLLAGEITAEAFARHAGAAATTARLDQHAVSLDVDRRRRCGFPEVVYGQGKPAEAVAEAMRVLVDRGDPALATRVTPEQAEAVQALLPGVRHNPVARVLRAEPRPPEAAAVEPAGTVAVITAGTTDLPVAEEARETLDWMGVAAPLITDVGVAGPHRLPDRLAEFASSDAVVVVAGMEGALPSVVGGYVACPVVAAPTSVGYGANFGGLAALLSMLNSCASNVAVVNIDAGFKAGYLAGMIARRAALPATGPATGPASVSASDSAPQHD
ncbi:MAG: nickel pincer cofactor biosynthesis protein LarB [Planctomycetota bacterium]